MKKWFAVLFFGLVFMMNMTVHAAESLSAEEIVEKCSQRMAQIKVFCIKEYMEYQGDRSLVLELATDENTNVTYINLFGIKMYTDANENLMYFYDREDNHWYIFVDNCGEFGAGDYTEIDQDADTSYEYKGVTTFYGNECETVLLKTAQGNDEVSEMTMYIKCDTYEICGTTMCQDGIAVEVVYTYPECVEIPDYVKKDARLCPGETITYEKIKYMAVQSGEKIVMKVTNGKKVASKKVTIPDSVSFAGRKYQVTEIGDKAFKGNQRVEKVIIGKNVKKIGSKAFYGCKKLSRVQIDSKKITKIGNKAFYGNAKRLKIKVPKAKYSKYKRLLKKSKISSKYTVSRI